MGSDYPTYEISKHLSEESRPVEEVLTEIRILHLNNSTHLKGPIFVTEVGANFMVADLGGHEVYLYDKSGEEIKGLKSINKGKEHFNFIGQLWRHKDEFSVYDPTSMAIFHYSLDGILKIRKNTRLSNATSLVGDASYYYFDLNRIAPFGIPHTNHNIEVYDRDMKRVKSLIRYAHKMPLNTGVSFSNFNLYDSSILYHQPHSEEVYRLSSGDIKIEAKIDFGNYWAWRRIESIDKISRHQFNELRNQRGLVISFNSWFSDEFVFLKSHGNGMANNFLISRNTGSIQKIDFASIFKSFVVNRWYLNQLQLTVSTDVIEELLSRSIESEIEIKEMNKPSDNEFSIVWLVFRDE